MKNLLTIACISITTIATAQFGDFKKAFDKSKSIIKSVEKEKKETPQQELPSSGNDENSTRTLPADISKSSERANMTPKLDLKYHDLLSATPIDTVKPSDATTKASEYEREIYKQLEDPNSVNKSFDAEASCVFAYLNKAYVLNGSINKTYDYFQGHNYISGYKNDLYAHEAWEKFLKRFGAKLNIPTNTGLVNEVYYIEFRKAAILLAKLHDAVNPNYGMYETDDPGYITDSVKWYISKHESTNLKGEKSIRGQAFIVDAQQIYKANKTLLDKQSIKAKKAKAYYSDPQQSKIADEIYKLNYYGYFIAEDIKKTDVSFYYENTGLWFEWKHTRLTDVQNKRKVALNKETQLRNKYGL